MTGFINVPFILNVNFWRAQLNLYVKSLLKLMYCFILCAQRGARTQDLEIKSLMLYRLS